MPTTLFDVMVNEDGEVDVYADEDDLSDLDGFIDAFNDGLMTSPGTYEVTATKNENGVTYKATLK